ncbi:MAG: flp pilus-assembly TadE/G-like family protein [Propionibacteriaceae bacterium]|jgi:secretion/DNA translocation related TadE-like protein|nr:flp pilus-assembly TadE/G-like family protein [Propionibacteriaceae bacterium]
MNHTQGLSKRESQKNKSFRPVPSRGSREKTCGSGTLSTIITSIVIAVALLIVGGILSYVLALHKSHSASDLAALTAATHARASLDDRTCCSLASDIATANGAKLTSCEVVRAASEVAASVTVIVEVPWKIPGLSKELPSTSYAGNPYQSG